MLLDAHRPLFGVSLLVLGGFCAANIAQGVTLPH
jgi:hypothetical protein